MSRKALVPIELPADPTKDQEAATKHYVDLMNEVYIGTTDPGISSSYELWYDPSAVSP